MIVPGGPIYPNYFTTLIAHIRGRISLKEPHVEGLSVPPAPLTSAFSVISSIRPLYTRTSPSGEVIAFLIY